MAIELDHVFVNVGKGFPEKEKLSNRLHIGNGRRHEGQGTEAEFLAFEKNYLEFIWLADEQEASQNPLELDKRFLANQCSFGVAFRGQLDESQASSFWQYKPPYLSKGCIWVHKSHKEDFSLPMIFVVDVGLENEAMWPIKKNIWAPDQILPGEFKKIIINGPMTSQDLQLPQLEFKSAENYSMEISGVGGLMLESVQVFSDM